MEDSSSREIEAQILSSVNGLSDQDFKIIVDASVAYLQDSDKIERLNTLNKTLVDVENSRECAKWVLKVLTAALKQKVEPAKIEKFVSNNHGLSNETKLNIVKQSWEKSWNDLIKSIEERQPLTMSQLVDMEWKFGVTSSTNFIDKYGSAFLQLKLVYNKGGQLESKFMEMNLPQFYSFLYEMNKAKSQMDYLS